MIDAQQYRQIIGRFATGVTVITTRVDDQFHGMTANALCSVSLDPLLLLVCVDRKATCHRQLSAAMRFGVNILRADQEEISNAFAKVQAPHEGRLPGVEQVLSESGVPLIKGCLAHLVCRVAHSYDGGDHTIFLGEVEEGSDESPDDSRADSPLLYFASGYRRLA